MAVVRLLRLTDAKLCSDRLLLRLPARLPGLSLPSASGLYKETYNTTENSFLFLTCMQATMNGIHLDSPPVQPLLIRR